MRVGDCLEWLAGALLVLAAYLFSVGSRFALPALVAGLFLLYQAQCFAGHTFDLRLPRLPKLPKLLRLHLPKRAPRAPQRDLSKVMVLPPAKTKRKKGRRS